jgi:hypothetical protein
MIDSLQPEQDNRSKTTRLKLTSVTGKAGYTLVSKRAKKRAF